MLVFLIGLFLSTTGYICFRCSDVLNSEECQTKSFSLLNVCFFQSHFLVYLNDIVDNIHCDIKLFADDTSIFSVVWNDRSSEELNRDLERLRLWSWQWKIHFNEDKTEEVICSTKRNVPHHDPLKLGNDEIDRKKGAQTHRNGP